MNHTRALTSEDYVFFAVLCKLIFSIASSIPAEEQLSLAGEQLVEQASNWTLIFDFVILGICFLGFSKVEREFRYAYEMFIVSAIVYVVASVVGNKDIFTALSNITKPFLPLLLFSYFTSVYAGKAEELLYKIKVLSVVILLLIFYGFAFLPLMANRNDGDLINLWWPAYFLDLHTTSYVATSLSFMFFVMIGNKYSEGWFLRFSLMTIPVILTIAFGWGVRTSAISIVFFYSAIAADYFITQKNIQFYYFIIFMLFLASVLFAAGNFELINQVSSGRLDMYSAKIEQLSNNSLLSWMIGNGAGSDLIYTDIWWWAAKGAHNDFLTFIVEGGLVLIGCLLFSFYIIYNNSKSYYTRVMFLAILLPSCFSNAFLVRPIAFYVAVFPLAYLYLRIDRRD